MQRIYRLDPGFCEQKQTAKVVLSNFSSKQPPSSPTLPASIKVRPPPQQYAMRHREMQERGKWDRITALHLVRIRQALDFPLLSAVVPAHMANCLGWSSDLQQRLLGDAGSSVGRERRCNAVAVSFFHFWELGFNWVAEGYQASGDQVFYILFEMHNLEYRWRSNICRRNFKYCFFNMQSHVNVTSLPQLFHLFLWLLKCVETYNTEALFTHAK